MAKLTTSQALENYRNKTIQDLSAKLQDSTKASMARRNAISFKEDDEDKPPKPSEILREYQARIEMEEIQEQELERRETGMSRGEFKDYEDTVETQKALAKTLASEKRTVSRTIASEGRAAEKVKATAIADKVEATEEKKAEDQAMQKKIEEGSGFLPSIIKGQFPKTQTIYSSPNDINIIEDALDAPPRNLTKAYFTLDDIDYMIANDEFYKADISQAKKTASINEVKFNPQSVTREMTREKVMKALNVDPETGKTEGLSIFAVQELMFEFLKSPYGSGMSVAQNMKFKDPEKKDMSNKELFDSLRLPTGPTSK